MKVLQFVFIALLATMLLAPSYISAQKHDKKTTNNIILVDDSEVEHTIPTSGVKFYTKGGNFLWTFKVKVPADVMDNIDFSPYANGIKEIEVYIESVDEILVADGYLNKAGNLHIELHKNGAGNSFPIGWFK